MCPFLILLTINLVSCKTASQKSNSSTCATGNEVTVSSLDQTAPSVTMDIYFPNSPILSVSSTSAPISSIVGSHDVIEIGARGNDPEGIKDIQIWLDETYWPTPQHAPGLQGIPNASNLNYVANGGIGCTARLTWYNLDMLHTISQTSNITNYKIVIRAVAINFAGTATASSSVTLWWPNAGSTSSVSTWWPGWQTPSNVTFWWTGGHAPIVDPGLYMESTHPEIFEIHNNKKIWIPTPDALLAMGYNYSDVKVVADGALNSYERFNIPSTSATPGSIIFPKDANHWPINDLPNTTSVISQQSEVQLIELRGWLKCINVPDHDFCGCCGTESGDGTDYHLQLALDMDWVQSQGWDIHKLLRVGNIVVHCQPEATTSTSPTNMVSLPLIHCELNSWGWISKYPPTFSNTHKPIGWDIKSTGNGGNLQATIWPFDPGIDASGTNISAPDGDYVKIWGSIVTDDPHEGDDFWAGSAIDWDNRSKEFKDPSHNARWTELHTIDKIVFVDNRIPRVTTRGVALCAGISIPPNSKDIQFDLRPEEPRPNNYILRWDTSRGPESNFHSDANNGSWITVFDDHIHVYAKVWGGGWGGKPGRLKIIYTVWWEPDSRERFRQVNRYAVANNRVGGFPDFEQSFDENGNLVYGTIFFASNGTERRVVTASDLLYTGEDFAERSRAASRYATNLDFIAGFPDWEEGVDGNGNILYGIILLGASVAERRVIKGKVLEYIGEDIGERMRSAGRYAVKNGFIGGFPDWEQSIDSNGDIVYGIILLKTPYTVRQIILAEVLKN